ncbi:MAG: DUF3301 domain-containing protein [Burkholderiales bacterium]|nr:DUF3301 domain-containing protein [Burkholderiales bacterium]
MAEATLVAALAALVWFLWDSLKAREAANAAIRPACRAEGLLFLDDTVALARIRPQRDVDGRLRLGRVYRFEYSDTGTDRRRGSVTLLGTRILHVELEAPPRTTQGAVQ